MSCRFSHVAVTVPVDQLVGVARDELLQFYREVFGWHENPRLAIPGERIFLRAPTDAQYITIRASATPMQTCGYEHLGIVADSEAELREIHGRAFAIAPRFSDLALQPIQRAYGGILLTFRVRFRLPLTVEVQHIRRA